MSTPISRRDFIRTSSTAASLTALASVYAPGAHAAGAEGEIKVGLVGCGGRGTGAASQALMATDAPVKLWAMADLFPENLVRSHDMLAQGAEPRYDREEFASLADKMDVPEERRFVGFDAYQTVIASDVDLVILATPPHFRPRPPRGRGRGRQARLHGEAGGGRPGGHPPGDRRRRGGRRSKSLSVVAGTQRRHQDRYLEIMRRVRDGAIGEIVGRPVLLEHGQPGWHCWMTGSRPARRVARHGVAAAATGSTSRGSPGDHICEQHVHNIDVMNWAIGADPVMAMGMGGRAGAHRARATATSSTTSPSSSSSRAGCGCTACAARSTGSALQPWRETPGRHQGTGHLDQPRADHRPQRLRVRRPGPATPTCRSTRT